MLCLLCSSLSAGSCPMGIYKNDKTDSCSNSTESGDSLCYVFRRPPDFLGGPRQTAFKRERINDTVTRVEFHNKYKEINLRAHSADRVSGPNSGLNPDENVSTRTKGFRPDRIMSSNFINDISDSKVSRKSSREDEFLSPCSSSCPDLLQGNSGSYPSSNRQNQQVQQKTNLSSEAKSEIQWWIANVRQWNGRPFHFPSPSLIITTDAAKKGTGGIMQ